MHSYHENGVRRFKDTLSEVTYCIMVALIVVTVIK